MTNFVRGNGQATCRVCRRAFVNDKTPMGLDEICMMCRPMVLVDCEHCGTRCKGAYDGLKECADCRSVPVGTRQFIEKQRKILEAWTAPAEEVAK